MSDMPKLKEGFTDKDVKEIITNFEKKYNLPTTKFLELWYKSKISVYDESKKYYVPDSHNWITCIELLNN